MQTLAHHPSSPHVSSWILATFPWIMAIPANQPSTTAYFRSSLVIRFGLHRFMRINSPHLQIEIRRFANEASTSISISNSWFGCLRRSSVVGSTPPSLDQFQYARFSGSAQSPWRFIRRLDGCLAARLNFDIDGDFSACFRPSLASVCSSPPILPTNAIQRRFRLYARLGIPRHQIVLYI